MASRIPSHLLFADSSLIINGRFGGLLFHMGATVEEELRIKLPEKNLQLPNNVVRAPDSVLGKANISEFAELKAKTSIDWRAWVEVPPTSILVVSDFRFAKHAANYAGLAEATLGRPLAPVACILPPKKVSKWAHLGLRWPGNRMVRGFFSIEEFVETMEELSWDVNKFIQSGEHLDDKIATNFHAQLQKKKK